MIKNKGISLFELVVVVLIISIISVLAYPEIKNSMARYESFRALSTLNGVLSQSRSESSMVYARISICGTTNGTTCDSSAWSKGILVFYDTSKKDRLRQPEEKIHQHLVLNLKYGTLTWKGASANNIVFHGNSGLALGSNGSFFYCSDYGYSFRLYMSYMGNTRSEKLSNCS